MIVIEPPSSGAAFPALNSAGLSRFLTRARKAVELDGGITVLLAGDARLKELNRAFRRKNKPTDVLSFPAVENGEGHAGDLAISVETAARQAAEHGHSLDAELHILMLHGLLHLAGFDHEADHGEMRMLESRLRDQLKLPAGLIERVQPAPARTAKKASAKAGAKKSAKKAIAKKTVVKKAVTKKAAMKKTAAKKTATKKTSVKRPAR